MSSDYKFIYSEKVLKQLKKMDKQVSKYIINYIEKNLIKTQNPRLSGKALVGDKNGLWRYHIGDYRLICQINDHELVILALNIGHRREVYSKY